MLKFIRTDSTNIDFINLVKLLDANLAITDGDEHNFYHQFNGILDIKYVIVIYKNDKAIACGAIKHYAIKTIEVKRMFTLPKFRGKGFATQLLTRLESWAIELNYEKCILETGRRQLSAIALYKKNNYQIISNYGQYANVENSVCFEKWLNSIV